MPMIDADGCLLNVSVEGRGRQSRPDAVEFAGLRPTDEGAANEGAHTGVSRDPLYITARPWQVQRRTPRPLLSS